MGNNPTHIHSGESFLGTISPLRDALLVLPVLLSAALLMTPWYMMAPVPAVGLILLMVLFNYPAIAYYGIIFLIPFGTYRAILGGLKIHWLFAAILLAILGVRVLVYRRFPEGLKSSIWPWMTAYLMISLVAAIGSVYPQTANKTSRLLIVALLFLGLTLVMVNRRGFIRTLPSVLIWSVSLGSLLAVLGFWVGIGFFAEKTEPGQFTRGVGGSLDPNNMALMIVFIIPVLVYKIIHAETPPRRLLNLGLLLLNLGAMVATYSRGGMVVLVMAAVLITIEFRKRFRPQYLGIATMILISTLLLAWLMIPASYWERQKSLAAGEDFALKRRTSYLIVGWEAFKEKPLLGHGPGTFPDIYGESIMGAAFERKNSTRKRYAHNTYVETLVGTGILGCIGFLAILFHALASFNRAKKMFQQQNNLPLAELVGSYRISFVTTAIYLLIFSELFHKYLLLSIGLSQVSVFLASRDENEHDHGN